MIEDDVRVVVFLGEGSGTEEVTSRLLKRLGNLLHFRVWETRRKRATTDLPEAFSFVLSLWVCNLSPGKFFTLNFLS
jgi:hypothetical protein